jgi:hypothetical protein
MLESTELDNHADMLLTWIGQMHTKNGTPAANII